MKRRLDALLRQRELLHQHLQWLDEEIAAERSSDPVPPHDESTTTTAQHTTPAAATAATVVESALPELSSSEPDVRSLHSEVRRGCFLYFAIAIALLAGVVAFIYWRY